MIDPDGWERTDFSGVTLRPIGCEWRVTEFNHGSTWEHWTYFSVELAVRRLQEVVRRRGYVSAQKDASDVVFTRSL